MVHDPLRVLVLVDNGVYVGGDAHILDVLHDEVGLLVVGEEVDREHIRCAQEKMIDEIAYKIFFKFRIESL